MDSEDYFHQKPAENYIEKGETEERPRQEGIPAEALQRAYGKTIHHSSPQSMKGESHYQRPRDDLAQ